MSATTGGKGAQRLTGQEDARESGEGAVYDVATQQWQMVIINCNVPHGRQVEDFVAGLRIEHVMAMMGGLVAV